jgi:hypothetical protein
MSDLAILIADRNALTKRINRLALGDPKAPTLYALRAQCQQAIAAMRGK